MNYERLLALQPIVKERLVQTTDDIAASMRLLRVIDALGHVAAALAMPVPARVGEPWDDYVKLVKPLCTELSEALKDGGADLGEVVIRQIRDSLVEVRRFISDSRRGAVGGHSPATLKKPKRSTRESGPVAFAGGVRADTARFGASAPVSTPPSSEFVARFIAYGDPQLATARSLLKLDSLNVDGTAEIGATKLTRGTLIEVALSGKELAINGVSRSVQSFQWIGKPVLLTFPVDTGGLKEGTTALLCFEVMVAGIVLSTIALEVRIASVADKRVQQVVGRALARKAFASYASQDRQRVLDRVAAIRINARVDVFVDRAGLNPGELWKKRLEEEIDTCDTFMLFWSKAALESRWVRWEWKRALKNRGLQHMQFQPLTNRVKAPPELAAIHLKDAYMDLRRAAPSNAKKAVRKATS